MSEVKQDEPDLVAIVALPPGHTTASYLKEAVPKITRLAVKCKNNKDDKHPPENAEVHGYLTFLGTFLPWLETDAIMTPSIRTTSKIDKALELLFDPVYRCPPEIAVQAKRIYDKFEDEQWGRDNSPEVDDSSPPTSPSTEAPGRTAAGGLRTADMYRLARPPPPDHPIWGAKGIMHGFIIQPSAHRRFNYVLDPRCEAEKRPFKVFGHNGLEPGAWWPYQKVALFHGAHGHSMAGISGHPERGAWSVVVSGSSTKYEDLDSDVGDTIWYSSDHSHDNVDPVRIIYRSNMTQSLHTSIANGNPVRVLRSSGYASSKAAYAPACGIRYDGLYSVVKVVERKNARGGLYEQFQLVRRPDQKPLDEVCRSSPTRKQASDYAKIQEGY